jgi:2-polyprenyl-3-methyl-5-hydroxy-6-metoxy-1,4-benzoquinol methylase
VEAGGAEPNRVASITNGANSATMKGAAHPHLGAPAAGDGHTSPKYLVEEENRALCGAIGRPRRVLDVGCGIGLNGAAAKRRGAHVTGIELVPESIARAARVLDEVLAVDLASDAAVARGLGERKFDVMLFGDVLEHLADPAAVLRRLLPYLEDEGQVIVSLPNIAAWPVRLGLLAGRFEYQKSGILDDTHLRFFTRDAAERLVQESGLEVLRTEQNPMLVRALKDLIARAFLGAGPAGVPAGHEPTALRDTFSYKAYQGLVRPLEDVVANRAPGLFAFQNVVVARKPPRPRRLSLTVGMLTMDEEESVAAMIGEIRRVAPDAQILCVDSSTKDRTAEIAQSLGARVLRQVPPRGHGPAMELLMYSAAAQSELLIYLDCDFTYPADYIPVMRRMVEEEGVDVVNGARTRTRPPAMPVPNFLANRAFAAMAHAMHGIPTCDVHSGMRAYRSSVIRAFDFDGEGDALPIDTLLFPAKCGYRVVELPIDYAERVGASKLRKLAGTVWTFVRLARALPVGRRRSECYERR